MKRPEVSDPAGLAKFIISESGDDKRVWVGPECCALLEVANEFRSIDPPSMDRLIPGGFLGEVEVWVDVYMPRTTIRFHPSDPESEHARVIDASAYIAP